MYNNNTIIEQEAIDYVYTYYKVQHAMKLHSAMYTLAPLQIKLEPLLSKEEFIQQKLYKEDSWNLAYNVLLSRLFNENNTWTTAEVEQKVLDVIVSCVTSFQNGKVFDTNKWLKENLNKDNV